MSIAKASAPDYPELMDFLELSFKRDIYPRFEQLLPDLYQPGDSFMENTLILRDSSSGRIVSSAGVFPIDIKLGSFKLCFEGVGGVTTHPEFRGKNMMSEVLSEINSEIFRRNPPFSWLSGMRYRYGRWGWEKAGSVVNMVLAVKNENAEKSHDFNVSELAYDAIPWDTVLNLRDTQCPYCHGNAALEILKLKYRRTDLRFFLAVKGTEKAFAILREYELTEYYGSAEGVSDIVRGIFESLQSDILVNTGRVWSPYFDVFSKFMEHRAIITKGNFAVVNLRKCVELLCEIYEASETFIKNGCGANIVMLAGKNPEQSAFIGIENGRLTVSERRKGVADVKLDPMEAAALIFGPASASTLLGPDFRWMDTVFPLPIEISPLYTV